MQIDLESEEVSDFNKFREWWYAINPAVINPVVVFTHIEKYFKPKWQAPPVEQTADAGQLFDENATHWANLVGVEDGRCILKEKFIELYNQRTPDAGQLEKIIGDAYKAGAVRGYYEGQGVLDIEEPTKAQYIKQAIEQFHNLKQ